MPRYPWLTTWRLWHHLLHPPSHPLFGKTLSKPADNPTTQFITTMALFGSSLVFCGIWMLLIRLKLPISMVLLIVMVTLSTVYVLGWVIRISVTIAREHERGTYDLLCLPPSGALGANWAICAATMQRNDALSWLNFIRALFAGLLLFILVTTLITTAMRERVPNVLQFLRLFLDMTALVATLYVEHVQSVVLGSLVAMLVPVYSRTVIEVRVWAAGLFLTLQVVTLLAILLTSIVILPGWRVEVSPILLNFAMLYLMREGLIVASWRALAYHFNADPAEFNRAS